MGLSLMLFIHRQLLKRGLLSDLLPDRSDLEDNIRDLEAARAEIKARVAEEVAIRREVGAAVARLHELNKKNHYGESLRRAFGGR